MEKKSVHRNPIRKAFTVMIYGKERDVFYVDGKEHEGLNDTSKNQWIYLSDRLPDGMVPPVDSPYWQPYCVSILRLCWDIRFKQTNSTKEKWGETQFRNHTHVEMWCNGRLVYEFGTSGKALDFAMAKVQYLQVHLLEGSPYNFLEPETEQGRKIFWYGLPATIDVKSNTWEIGIVPDYTAGLEKKEWWKRYMMKKQVYGPLDDFDMLYIGDDKESKHEDYINWGDALSDQHINWFRK